MVDHTKLAPEALKKAERLRLAAVVLSCDPFDPRSISEFDAAHKAFGTNSFPALADACARLLRQALPDAVKSAHKEKKYRDIRDVARAIEAEPRAKGQKVLVKAVNSIIVERFKDKDRKPDSESEKGKNGISITTVERARRPSASPRSPLDEFLAGDLPPGWASIFRHS